jgi:ribosomal protein L37AE/L43A
MPRAARAPHSSKVPEACPLCGSHVLTRRGTRKKKLEIVQLWRCASCKKTFTPGPPALRNKTYPLRTVLDAVSTYSLGYSLEGRPEGALALALTRSPQRAARPVSDGRPESQRGHGFWRVKSKRKWP